MFDPYRKWLGIPEGQRPPTHYQLLGISPDEHDRDVINAAVVRQSAFVRTFQVGQYSKEATQLLNEISAAKVCLLDAAKRAAYDAQLSTATTRKTADQSGAFDLLRSSSLNPPPSGPSVSQDRPSAPVAPARPGYAAARRATASVAPAPLLSVPDDIWAADDLSQPRLPSAKRKADVGKPRVWLWAIPVGSLGLLLVVLLAIALTRSRPSTTLSQVDLLSSGVQPRLDSGNGHSNSATTGSARGAPQTVVPPSTLLPPTTGEPRLAPAPVQPPSVSSSVAEDEDPFKTNVDRIAKSTSPSPASKRPDSPGGKNRGAPSLVVQGASWSDGSTLSIPAARNGEIVFARSPGRFVAAGEVVYSLESGEAIGQVGAVPPGNKLTALSSDGEYFAVAEGATIEVRQCSDGETVVTLNGPPKSIMVRYLDFGAPGQLVSCTQISGDWNVQLWNLPSGKLAKDFKLQDSFQKATLSNDGRYLATAVTQYGIVIYDLQKSPSKGKGKISARIPITALERHFIDVDGMSFSPSGEELAAVCDNGARLLCWDKTTHLVLEHALDGDQSSLWTGAWTYRGPAIEWHPAGRGWLVKGHFFLDRQRRRITWLLKTELGSDGRHRFFDEDRLLLARGSGDNRELVDLKIPWQKIDDSLAAMNDEESSAWLGPQQPVSVRLQIGPLSGGASPQQVESDLQQLFASRLAAEGIKVAPDQPVGFSIDYAETYEPSKTIAPPNLPGMRFNIPARQVPGQTTCTMNIRLQAGDSSSELWTSKVTTGVSDGDPVGQRSAIYAALGRQLRGALLPYFVPKDKDLVALPAVVRP